MTEPNGMKRLVKEAHRRSLWQVMILYMATSWAVLEAADHVIERFGMPDWAYGTAVLLLLIGFPIVMATAIVQEGVGGDTARDPTSASEQSGTTHARGAATEQPSSASDRPDVSAEKRTAETRRAEARSQPAFPLHRLFTWRNAILGGVAAFGLWGVVATGLLLTSGERAASEADTDSRDPEILRAIAVLPFDNLSAEAENAYFADGIHEDILTQLSRIGDLTVISRTSVLGYRETDKSLQDIATELGVGSILEGSVRRAGDNVRITAQLIDAATDQHLWADNFDRTLTAANVFSIQTEIARHIADALRATLSPEEEARLAHQPTASIGAYDFYSQGRAAYSRYTDADNDEAIRLFTHAIELDPEFAEAWAGLADAYGQRVERFAYGLEWADSAEAAARRAIELNPESGAGYKALALSMDVRSRHDEALELNLRAAELDPSNAGAAANAAVQYWTKGEFDGALAWFRRSMRIAPGPRVASQVALSYLVLGMERPAERLLNQTLELDSNSPEALFFSAWIDAERGDDAAVLSKAERLAEAGGGPGRLLNASILALWAGADELAAEWAGAARDAAPSRALFTWHHVGTVEGLAQSRMGNQVSGEILLRQAAETLEANVTAGTSNSEEMIELAAIHARLGDEGTALRWVRRGYDDGYRLTYLTRFDPVFEPLMATSEFRELVRQMEADLAAQRQRAAEWERPEGLR